MAWRGIVFGNLLACTAGKSPGCFSVAGMPLAPTSMPIMACACKQRVVDAASAHFHLHPLASRNAQCVVPEGSRSSRYDLFCMRAKSGGGALP